ncbi:MAG: hypothetical protein HFH68_00735 [Lachnospiraceae bacterium]|nr:hypothetical protein [Lachnospiraceae bacterium]
MQIIDHIKIINNSIDNDIIVEWCGHSEHKIKVSVKYQLMGRTGWADFVDEYKDSINQMVSFHRELRGERGLYSFLFTCKDIGDMRNEIASYKLDNIMLGKPVEVFYHETMEEDSAYIEFTEVEENRVVPANYLCIEMMNKKYPIGFDIQKGSKVFVLKNDIPRLYCSSPYEKMYKIIKI